MYKNNAGSHVNFVRPFTDALKKSLLSESRIRRLIHMGMQWFRRDVGVMQPRSVHGTTHVNPVPIGIIANHDYALAA